MKICVLQKTKLVAQKLVLEGREEFSDFQGKINTDDVFFADLKNECPAGQNQERKQTQDLRQKIGKHKSGMYNLTVVHVNTARGTYVVEQMFWKQCFPIFPFLQIQRSQPHLAAIKCGS